MKDDRHGRGEETSRRVDATHRPASQQRDDAATFWEEHDQLDRARLEREKGRQPRNRAGRPAERTSFEQQA